VPIGRKIERIAEPLISASSAVLDDIDKVAFVSEAQLQIA
jgi:hypothetical protein